MWQGAKALLDRPPLCLATHPVAGAALGLLAGAVFGTLCGALHMAALGEPRLFLPWLLVAAAGATLAGCIMGFGTAMDRVVNRAAWEEETANGSRGLKTDVRPAQPGAVAQLGRDFSSLPPQRAWYCNGTRATPPA